MTPSDANWTPALVVLALGVGVGLYLWRLLRAAPRTPADAGHAVRALETRRDALIAELRALDDASSQLTPAELTRERGWLEIEAARVLRELDRQGAAQKTKRPQRAPAASDAAPAGGSTLRGFLWGARSVAVLALLFYLATQAGQSRTEGATSGTESAAGSATPDDPETVALRRRIEQNPEDVEARLDLARRALAANDMMSVFNETRFVLEREPDEPRALTYQAVVRLAMGQASKAQEMLERVIALRPDLEDAHVYLMLVHTEAGDAAGADKALARAVKQFPSERPNLEAILARMRSEASASGRPPLQEAGDNPHAALDAPAAAMRSNGQRPAAPAASAASSVSGTISLAPDAKAPTSSRAAIYLMLWAAGQRSGPPLAVKKLPAGAFPAPFEIGAADSMTGATLPPRVQLEARLDEDGDVATRPPQEPLASVDGIVLGARGVHLTLTPRR